MIKNMNSSPITVLFKGTLLALLAILSGCADERPVDAVVQADYGLYHASLSDDGRYALVATVDHAALVWNIEQRQLLHTWRHKANDNKSDITLTAMSPNGQFGATVDGAVFAIWQVQSGKTLRYWQMPEQITTIKLSNTGRYALIGLRDATAHFVDLQAGRTRAIFNHDAPITAIALSPDNQLAATGAQDNTVKVWQLSDGALVRSIAHRDVITALAFSADSKILFTAAGQFQAQSWNIGDGSEKYQLQYRGELLQRIKPANMTVTHARFSTDGQWLFTSSPPSFVRQWNAKTGAFIKQWTSPKRTIWKPPGNVIFDFAINEQQQRLITEAADGVAYIWVL